MKWCRRNAIASRSYSARETTLRRESEHAAENTSGAKIDHRWAPTALTNRTTAAQRNDSRRRTAWSVLAQTQEEMPGQNAGSEAVEAADHLVAGGPA